MRHMQARVLGRPKSDSARDLRRDLLLTSRQMLDEGGPTALSMREVARRTACTHQAPYHYFDNRESILAALKRHLDFSQLSSVKAGDFAKPSAAAPATNPGSSAKAK